MDVPAWPNFTHATEEVMLLDEGDQEDGQGCRVVGAPFDESVHLAVRLRSQAKNAWGFNSRRG